MIHICKLEIAKLIDQKISCIFHNTSVMLKFIYVKRTKNIGIK